MRHSPDGSRPARHANRPASPQVVAVLGAGGIMGFAMARRLARAGFGTRAWNRSPDKARPLEADGAILHSSPAEAAEGAAVVLTMLADVHAVLAVMGGRDGALSRCGGDAIWLQMSTVGEAGLAQCGRLAERHGVPIVDAPVLGTRQPAEDGELVILASGPEQVRASLQPLFDALGNKTLWLGEAGAGSRLKLVLNSWVLAVVEAGAESVALAEGLGLDPALLLEAIEGGALDLPYLRTKTRAILSHDFDPMFTLSMAAKDASLAERAAAVHGLDLPMLRLLRQRLELGARQHGEKDFCATYLTCAPRPA
jgi:3-hydroxyisobutyrate dehydrogenase